MAKSTKIIILTIGMMSILAGFYFLISGGEFDDYWFSFFTGIVLIGTLFIDQKREKAKKL